MTIHISALISCNADQIRDRRTSCEALYKFGIDAIFDTVPGIITLEEAMEHAKENLERTAENVLRIFLAGSQEQLR